MLRLSCFPFIKQCSVQVWIKPQKCVSSVLAVFFLFVVRLLLFLFKCRFSLSADDGHGKEAAANDLLHGRGQYFSYNILHNEEIRILFFTFLCYACIYLIFNGLAFDRPTGVLFVLMHGKNAIYGSWTSHSKFCAVSSSYCIIGSFRNELPNATRGNSEERTKTEREKKRIIVCHL